MNPAEDRREHALRWAGALLLLVILSALGVFLAPRHWTSIWGDPEFTDWVSPIANRLHGNARLYEPGLHNPIPPLSYVLVRWCYPGGATWFHENALHLLFQTGTIFLLYLAFMKEVRATVAFAAALAAIPVFFALPKAVLYDSMAQFLVVICAMATLSLVRAVTSGSSKTKMAVPLRAGALATALALLLLTKQSTAAGALLGVVAALLGLPRSASPGRRLRVTALVLLAALAALVVAALLLSQFVSFDGMLRDVFLTGSEPKGGGLRVMRNLLIFGIQIGLGAATIYCLYQVLNACFCGTATSNPPPAWLKTFASGGEPATSGGSRGLLILALLMFLTGLMAEWWLVKFRAGFPAQFFETTWGTILLNLGLIPCLWFALAPMLGRTVAGEEPGALSIYSIVFLSSAVFHNLSVNSWLWLHHNNPLIYLALVFVIGGLLSMPSPKTGSWWLRPALLSFVLLAVWPLAAGQLRYVQQCTQPWPEVAHLDDARLRPDSAGMRELVELVRDLIKPDEAGTVLLLPEDPNVAAWFERRRPTLSSAIIFTDQYWDRYVEEDFAALRANPPKVIIIGPKNFWRVFSRKWNRDRGAERLINRVQAELLPSAYQLRATPPITFQGTTDFMEVYVRSAP